MERLLLRPTEAADVLAVSRSKVYEMLGTGELPVVRIGTSLRVPAAELRKWIQRQLPSTEPMPDEQDVAHE